MSLRFIFEAVARCKLTVLGSALRSRCCQEIRSSCSPWALSSAGSRCCASSAASRCRARSLTAQRAITSGGLVVLRMLLWLVVGCRSLRPLVCVRNSPLFPQLPKTRENWSTQHPPLLASRPVFACSPPQLFIVTVILKLCFLCLYEQYIQISGF